MSRFFVSRRRQKSCIAAGGQHRDATEAQLGEFQVSATLVGQGIVLMTKYVRFFQRFKGI
jgi:hypothetical protein